MDESYKLLPDTRPVHGQEQHDAIDLGGVVSEVVDNATPTPTGDGVTWQYGGETVTFSDSPDSPADQRHIAPGDDLGATFHILDGEGRVLGPVEIAGRALRGGEHAEAFHRIRTGIYLGHLVGSHEIFATKVYAEDDSADGAVVLQATVTAASRADGGITTPTIDLRFMRDTPNAENPYGDSTVIQTHRITHDWVTGNTEVGSGVHVEAVVETPGNEPTRMYDPFVEDTTTAMQRTFQPQTPLNQNLPTQTWQRLVTGPLTGDEALRAPAAE